MILSIKQAKNSFSTLDEQFYVTTSNFMLQAIVESVTSLGDNQMYLLYLTYMDKSSILCEVKCPLILLLRRDPLKKFWNVLRM